MSDRYKLFMQIIPTIIMSIIFLMIFNTYIDRVILTDINILNFIFVFIILIAIMFVTILIYRIYVEAYIEPRSYSVAIVGYPKSGKTTLITSLFSEAFAKNLPIRMLPKGRHTIEIINKSIEILESGKALGPTTFQDIQSFRADVTYESFFSRRTYKVEFGDFPGGDSDKYINEYGQWLHNTDFFKWVLNSDAILFIIDVGQYLSSGNINDKYIKTMMTSLRAAWQHYIDANDYRKKEVLKHPVIIVFTKMDLLEVYGSKINLIKKDKYGLNELERNDINIIEKKIMEFGFGKNVPPLIDINKDTYEEGVKIITEDFKEIIDYFSNEVQNFDIVFTSCFGFMEGRRLGIGKILQILFEKFI